MGATGVCYVIIYSRCHARGSVVLYTTGSLTRRRAFRGVRYGVVMTESPTLGPL